MVVLGIDPGTRFAGYAILKKDGASVFLLDSGCLRLGARRPLPERLLAFHDYFDRTIKKWCITDLSLETPFLHKNAQNFLKLGYVRGILYLLAQKNKINLLEFSPREVKVSMTGFGGAKKDQVAFMVRKIFPHLSDSVRDDATDALAISMCALWKSLHRGVYKNML